MVESLQIPTTIFFAVGAVLAALLAGFFSLVGMISDKESKISEFRQNWIDGLRCEISEFTAAIHELVRLHALSPRPEGEAWIEMTSTTFNTARKNLSLIHLRMNPRAVELYPNGHEAKLLEEISRVRCSFLSEDYLRVVEGCDRIREIAAPFLKDEWDRVKQGEKLYRVVRIVGLACVVVGFSAVAVFVVWLLFQNEMPIVG